jgi:Right handed beta helix region
MAIINVANNSQLTSALKSARGGDEIRLAGGEYDLSMRNLSFSSEVTITSANAARPASFEKINLTSVKNLTFDGVDLRGDADESKPFVIRTSSDITIRDAVIDGHTERGYGNAHGIWITYTDGFTLENSSLTDFNVAAYFHNNTDMTIRDNSFGNIAQDAMILGGVHDVLIADNVVEMRVEKGTKHTDAIQFWNTGTNNPASNVTITGNYIATNGEASHGIYAANGLASSGTKAYFKDFEITDNTVISAQMSGIAIGETIGLTIEGNTVLQDTDFQSSREIRTPVIHVMGKSQDVSITDNVTHKTPAATGANWQELNSGNPRTWEVADNKIVKIGTTLKNAPSATSADDDRRSAAPAAEPAPAGEGDGGAQTFRFDGDRPGRTPDTISGFNFGEGDKIVLIDFAARTFEGKGGGNKLDVSRDGTYVKIDSAADLQELATHSAAVGIFEGQDDTLVIEIAQRGEPIQVIQIAGFADDYFG